MFFFGVFGVGGGGEGARSVQKTERGLRDVQSGGGPPNRTGPAKPKQAAHRLQYITGKICRSGTMLQAGQDRC